MVGDGYNAKMKELEKIIAYEFRDKKLLIQALTTPARRMTEPDAEDNQRLEFLGDAVFGLLSASHVFHSFPEEKEGLLTVSRTHLVSGAALARAGEKLGLRKFLRLNRGAAELPENSKVFADALEALMGAVWLDGGIEAAEKLFKSLDLPFNKSISEKYSNPKGHLQVRAQAKRRRPHYEVVSVEGPPHKPIVTVKVSIPSMGEATATAVSQHAAEVAAAKALLEKLDEYS
jgi:ribonuclease-3